LKNYIKQPTRNETHYETFVVGDQILIKVNLSTDCTWWNDELVSNASVQIKLQSPTGVWEDCNKTGSINDEGNGWYNCTWNTSFHMGGFWNISMIASKGDYYSDTTIWKDWFYLNNTPPEYGNFSVTPEEDGWGVTYIYKVDIYDTQQDNVTCDLFVKTNSGWEWKNSTIIYGGQGNCTLTVSNFDCDDIGTNNLYKFQLDDGTNKFNTTPDQAGPNITQEAAIIYYVHGNYSEVNRSGDQTTLLVLGIKDTDRNQSVGFGINATFYVTPNVTKGIYDDGTLVQTNNSGYLNFYFNPNCSPKYEVGPQHWKARITDICYNNSWTPKNYTTTISGDLQLPIDPILNNNITKIEENVSVSGYLTTDCGWLIDGWLSGENVSFILKHNTSVINYTCTSVYEDQFQPGHYKCDGNTSDMKAGWYTTIMNSTKDLYNPGYNSTVNHFYIQTRPILQNVSVTPSPGGWGERFYFSVNVTDEDLDNETLELRVRPFGTAVPWTDPTLLKNSTNLISPLNQTVVLSAAALSTCNDFENYPTLEFRFRATDDRGLVRWTDPMNFSLIRDNAAIQISAGNGDWVWRNGTNSVLLSLKITDATNPDITVGLGAKGAIWVTTNASNNESWDAGRKDLTTDANSYLNYSFMVQLPSGYLTNGCNYTVGIHQWRGGVYNDSCWNDQNSTNFTLTIKSELLPDVRYPLNDKGFLRGNQVPVNGSLSDDCTAYYGYIPNATVWYKLHNQPQDWTPADTLGKQYVGWYCGEWVEEDGWYNTTWYSHNPLGKWDIMMYATKEYYAPSMTTEIDAFYLATTPSLQNFFINLTKGGIKAGWGEKYQFQVDPYDEDLNVNNLTLWKSFDMVNWTLVDSRNITPPWSTEYFYERFSCEDLLSPGPVNYFNITMTDKYGFSTGTEILNITFERDNITLNPTPRSNSTIRRMGSNLAYLEVLMNDIDFDGNPTGAKGRIWVTRNGSDYDIYYNCTTSNGYCQIYHDPNETSTVGIQKWKGESLDECYQLLNSSETELTVIGQQYVNINNPTQGFILTRNLTYPFNATVYDDCNVSLNDSTVTWYNQTWYQIATGYNTTWTVPYLYQLGPETIYVNTTRQYYDLGSNSTTVTIYGWSEIYNMTPVNGSLITAGENKKVRCYIRDANETGDLIGFWVNFTKDGEYLQGGTDDVGVEPDGTYAWRPWYTSGETTGPHNLSCIIEAQCISGNCYNASTPIKTSIVNIYRPLFIKQIIVDNSTIYRNGTYKSPSKTNITIYVFDSKIGPANFSTVKFYNSTSLIDSCTANQTGWCSITYNASSEDVNPGPYTIYINVTKTGTDNSTTNQTVITIKGGLILNMSQPVDTSWNKDEDIDLKGDLWDENGNEIHDVSVYWYIDGSEFTDTMTFVQAQWPLSGIATGYKNLTVNITINYYDVGETWKNITISGLANVEWAEPSESTTPWSDPFYVSCKVVDKDTAPPLNGIPGYAVNFSYKIDGSWIYNGTYWTNGTEFGQPGVGYAGYTWTPEDKGPIDFNCTISDNQTKLYEANIWNVTKTITITDVTKPQIFNASIIPNVSLEANLKSTNITAFVTDDYGIENVSANITLPNGTHVIVLMDNVTLTKYVGVYSPVIGGIHDVNIIAMDKGPEYNVNSSFAGNFSVWGKTEGLIMNDPNFIIAWGITQTQFYSFDLSVNFTNLGPVPAYEVNLTIYENTAYAFLYNGSQEYFKYCDNMYVNETCYWAVRVTVPSKTPSGLINLFTSATWRDADNIWNSTTALTEIDVSSNPLIKILEDEIEGIETPHDRRTLIGNLTISSYGNDPAFDVAITWLKASGNLGLDCSLCDVILVPPEFGYMPAGDNETTDVYVKVPFGQSPGIYWTFVRAYSTNAGNDTTLINVTVPLNMTWTRTPPTFGTILAPLNTEGSFGPIVVKSYGNVKILLTTFKSGNASQFITRSPTSLDLSIGTVRNISLNYTIGQDELLSGLYYGYILIRNSTQDQKITDFWLDVRDVPPTITDVNITPLVLELTYGNVSIEATITDNFNVSTGWINVTLPSNVTFHDESKLIYNMTSESKLIHNSTMSYDHGFNYSELIDKSGDVDYFNITIVNLNDSTIYFNLTVNDVIVSENQSLVSGENITVDAKAQGASFTLPGDQTINLTVMNASGSLLDVNYLTYLNYTISDDGFNYTESITTSGEMKSFNFTIFNLNGTTIYFNLTINDNLILYNQSVATSTNFTIDAVGQTSFTLPGNQIVNLTITDVTGTISSAQYLSWIDYTIQLGNYTYYSKIMDSTGSRYYTTYNSSILGIHKIRVCANDTAGLVACTSPTDLLVAGITILKVFPNITDVPVNGITLDNEESFGINITLNNTGYARAFDANVTVIVPENISYGNWSAVPYFFTYGLMLGGSIKSNETEITVPAGTPPGQYLVNFTPEWINLDGTINSSLTSITVNVGSNPVLDITEESKWLGAISPGTEKTTNIVINSTGNDNVTDIEFYCIAGELCGNDNLTASLSPENVSVLPPNQIETINVTINVSAGFETGIYWGIIKADAGNTYDTINISFLVPLNMSWLHNPTSIKKEVIQGTNGSLGVITIQNMGNVFLTLNVSTTGNVSDYISVNTSTLYVDVGGYSALSVSYSAPTDSEITTYLGYITTENISADPPNQTTLVNLTVHPYFVDIIYPTHEQYITGVSQGDEIQIKVNLTYSNISINESVNWTVSLSHGPSVYQLSLDSTNYSTSEKVWLLNFTAPNIPSDTAYDLNVTANDTIRNLFSYDIEAEAIIYQDNTPPTIDVTVPGTIPTTELAEITAVITETGGVETVYVNITKSDNTTESYEMNLLTRENDTYTYKLYYTNTSLIGKFEVNATACDKSDNCNSDYAEFETYPAVRFHGYTYDMERLFWWLRPIKVDFKLYDNDTDESLYNFSSNATTGYYNKSISARGYDLNVHVWNETIDLYDTSILYDVYNPIIFGRIDGIRIGRGSLKGLYVDTVLNSSSSILTMDYSECYYEGCCRVAEFAVKNLGIYHCDWIRLFGCNSSWSRLPNTILNTSTGTISVNLTGYPKGAYALAEYICGNDNCEENYGESFAVCPQDCQPPTPVTVPTAGGGRGGGGGGETVVPGVTLPPYEIRSTLLYVTLKPGEEEIHSMDITNNLPAKVDGKITVEGMVWELIMVDEPTFTLNAHTTKVTRLKVFTLPSTMPGIYTGDIVTTLGSETHRTPITVKVELPAEPLLDVKVKVLTESIGPGDELKFEVNIINMGSTTTVEDITVNYTIKDLTKKESILTLESETLAVENTLTFVRSVEIPENTPPDRYMIEVVATYWYGHKYATATDAFDVNIIPGPVKLLRAVFSHWLTYAILFAVAPGAYLGILAYKRWKTLRKVKAKYILPVNFKKLPKAGTDSVLVGKIAETDVKAYLNVEKLMMHSLAAGGTGSGKSVSAMIVAEELLKRGVPVIVFDPTAQWTGFIRACKDKNMLKLYPKFGLKPSDATAFKTNIIDIVDPKTEIDVRKHMKPGEITVFVLNKLPAGVLDSFVRKTIDSVFAIPWPESREIKLLIVYDEVHRLLPKYGGKGGYVALEKGCREFRKWGIGLFMISQVLMDFRGAIRANIATEIQLRTKYEGDINRVKTKYGSDYAAKTPKLTTGTALVQNPEFNDGKPWFIAFRPLLHDTFRLTEKELKTYAKFKDEVTGLEERLAKLKARKIDTYDVELELNLAKDKMKSGMFRMADTYLESVKSRIGNLEKK